MVGKNPLVGRMILSKEEQLLLACARLELSELDTRTARNLLEDSLDWSAVMEMADNHAVTPLIYYHLKEKHDNPTPPPGPSLLKGESRVGALNAAIPSQARDGRSGTSIRL
jgi:hypothetical protein